MKKASKTRAVQVASVLVASAILCVSNSVGVEHLQSGLLVLCSYESPEGAYHTILRNTSGRKMEIEPVQLRHRSDDKHVPTWWMRVDPKVVKPGQWTHFYFKARNDDLSTGLLKAEFNVSGRELALDIRMSSSEIDVTYAPRDSSSNRLYFYLRNNVNSRVSIHSVKVNGAALSDLCPTMPVELAAGEKGLVFGHLEGLDMPAGGVLPVHVEIVTTEKTLHRFAYIFSDKRFEVKEEDDSIIMTCPTHDHGTYGQAAEKLFRLAEATVAGPRCVHICRSHFVEGIGVFGQCIEAMRVHPQASNPDRQTAGWLRGLLDLTSECKRRSEPGIFLALIKPVSSLPGSKATAITGRAELREVVYAEIACGAKGIQFRSPDSQERQYLATTRALSSEIHPIAPYLAISEPMDLASHCSINGVVTKTLLCGDKAVILIVLREDIHQSGPMGPVDAFLTLPRWFKSREFIEIGGARRRGRLIPCSQGVRLKIEELYSVGVYLLPSARDETSATGLQMKGQ